MRFLWVQPIYQDSIHFIGAPGGGRTIEVSFFDVTHIADPEGDQGYERKLINDMHDMQSRINGEVFADENAATDGADVRPRPRTACPCLSHAWPLCCSPARSAAGASAALGACCCRVNFLYA